MLQNLHVKNLALIDEADVEFGAGLNILSGETGAGKSIIIGSIGLALGEKPDKGMLRDGDEPAFVELIFTVEDENVKRALEDVGVDSGDGTLILSRKITGGRSVARINGEAVSAASLREVSALLIDIHGQHEHQSLLQKRKHLELLDAYAREALGDRPARLAETYREYQKAKQDWEGADTDGQERRRELSLLEYEVREIEEAGLVPGEDEELEARFKKLSNGRKIMDALSAAHQATGGDESGAAELIGRALRELSSVSEFDGRIAEMEGQLSDVENLLSDFNHEVSSYMDGGEFDDKAFYEVQTRLDTINHLKSKYGSTIGEILSECEKKSQRIEILNNYEDYLANLSATLEEKEGELKSLCEAVSAIRKEQAPIMCAAIREALADLNFLDVSFEMEFGETDGYTAHGKDDPEFMISMNPGEPPRPLGKIASGGELSRIMLAIKTVMADIDGIPTLIFDEIDSGISGRTAQMVSEKMNLLSRKRQVICITHLPQIAAMADLHFLIEKSVENASTYSRIGRLGEEGSVAELARMLGGVEITDTVREGAREMRQLALAKKNS
ncbi:MAG: DNA repair protein RecN [Clostridiales bacterium]|nr:DNA repair protein RecN [Clostridiales bacterium]